MRTGLKGRKVIVIDDDKHNCELIRDALAKDGCIVEIATNGREGIHKIEFFKPDLVLMDQDMPEITGLETLRLLRSRENYVAVIFISAGTSPQTISEALDHSADDYIRKPFSLQELAARVAVRFRIKDLHDRLQQMNDKLNELAQRDVVTGLFNMRSMYEKIETEIERARRFKRHVACIMMDMDHFKSVNDGHDHLFGSFVLKEVGRLINDSIRKIDIAARYGGDEFLIVLSETDDHGTLTYVERLRAVVEGHTFTDGKDSIRLTTSIGYALSPLDREIDAKTLVRLADHALYEAKHGGRNKGLGFSPREVSKLLALGGPRKIAA